MRRTPRLAAGLLALAAVAACTSAPEDRAERARTEFEPGPREVLVFFAAPTGCEVKGFPRTVDGGTPLAVTRAALDSLLAGPREEEVEQGWRSAIPDELETGRHRQRHLVFDLDPGHHGGPVAIRELKELEGGVLLVDFTAQMRAYDHGRSAEMPDRICAIVRQVQETAGQFPWWHGVRLAIEGESKGILQP